MIALFPKDLADRAQALVLRLAGQGLTVATAESCTGGLAAGLLTEVSGSSGIFGFGFVTYANEAKTELLGVRPELLAAHGAVSEPVARAMAEGALARAGSDLAVSAPGVAGPTGGSPEKPVGLVYVALAAKGRETICRRLSLTGDRTEIRLASVAALLDLLETPS